MSQSFISFFFFFFIFGNHCKHPIQVWNCWNTFEMRPIKNKYRHKMCIYICPSNVFFTWRSLPTSKKGKKIGKQKSKESPYPTTDESSNAKHHASQVALILQMQHFCHQFYVKLSGTPFSQQLPLFPPPPPIDPPPKQTNKKKQRHMHF